MLYLKALCITIIMLESYPDSPTILNKKTVNRL